ncbi:Serine-protein kinase RsbW [Poriferisphaera corsica]|uniref:Serine-protein kinase RsbW n=1 Tax=Poriferisphaera corsica TaxID=2528020 RepID=A0A517YSV2_9BACT|nr:ATP-binding protein [Poriferisphaera corsica]QDU33315.1 Serine-protein kinase RsbW [Poriferisphaera corsica]
MGDVSQNTITIPSRLSEVAKVQSAIVGAAREQGYSKEVIFAVQLSLDEAVTNAIRHGNKLDESKSVSVNYVITPCKITITICDEGDGFDPHHIPDPTLDENLTCPSGRGVMLIQAYMTSVSYNDKGNCLTLVKEKDCALPQ